MPYTLTTIPEWVKKFSEKYQRAFVTIFNNAMKQYNNEGRATKTAISQMKNMMTQAKDTAALAMFGESTKDTAAKADNAGAVHETFTESLSLTEANVNVEKREIIVDLIRAGWNNQATRFYKPSALKEAVEKKLFENVKNFSSHLLPNDKNGRGFRDIKDWMSTTTGAWMEGDVVKGKITIHDDWLFTRVQDAVARENLGLSINGAGKQIKGMAEGKKGMIIESIEQMDSVDWVPNPGAGGRVLAIAESDTENKNTEGGNMEWESLSVYDIKKNRPDLIEAIAEEKTDALQKELKEAKESADKAMEKLTLIESDKVKLETLKAKLDEAKLPELLRKKIEKQYEGRTFATVELLRESIDETVKAEKEFVEALQKTNPRITGMGENGARKAAGTFEESMKAMQARIDSQLGISGLYETAKDEGGK